MTRPRRILILFAHPALERSRTNSVLADEASRVDGVTVHDLYESYPDFMIDVKREQGLLVDHDVIIFQHPFYWYSAPSLVKEWQDLVLEHRWAYGVGGTALKGKIAFNAITTGGGRDAYQRDGFHKHGIRDFLLPHERTACLCGMTYLAPFVVHGSLRVEGRDQAAPFAASYRLLLEALRDNRLDIQKATRAQRLNDDLASLVVSP